MLLVAGVVCGILWELWNYWSVTKWVYEVPLFGEIKLFAMPVAGYLGFPAFALELFVLYNFVCQVLKLGAPKLAEPF